MKGATLVGSLLLDLYDREGLLHHVGFTSTMKQADKPARDQAALQDNVVCDHAVVARPAPSDVTAIQSKNTSGYLRK